jgi:hypothetical protein
MLLRTILAELYFFVPVVFSYSYVFGYVLVHFERIL